MYALQRRTGRGSPRVSSSSTKAKNTQTLLLSQLFDHYSNEWHLILLGIQRCQLAPGYA